MVFLGFEPRAAVWQPLAPMFDYVNIISINELSVMELSGIRSFNPTTLRRLL